MGASGFIGSTILEEALNRGHIVTAVSRAPEKLPAHANLHPAKADVSDTAALTEIFRGQDAIIHSYAPPPDPEVRAFMFAAMQAGDRSMATTASYVPKDAAAHDFHVHGHIDAQTSGTRRSSKPPRPPASVAFWAWGEREHCWSTACGQWTLQPSPKPLRAARNPRPSLRNCFCTTHKLKRRSCAQP